MIVHLNGWPGIGKLTIGRVLARRLGAKLVDNHLLHDVAIVCAGLSDPARWPLYESVRAAAYQTLSERPASESFVMTNALCVGSPREIAAWTHVVDLAVARCVPLVPVVLTADLRENERRLQTAERSGRKLVDPVALRRFIASDTIQRPDVPELLMLDVSTLSPREAADAIADHVTGLQTSGALQAATVAHHRLRSQAIPSDPS